jgi:SH3-like domain-containing protein
MESHANTLPPQVSVSGTVNLRSAPDGEVVSYRLAGDNVRVYHTQDGWCRITPSDAKPLWIFCELLVYNK